MYKKIFIGIFFFFSIIFITACGKTEVENVKDNKKEQKDNIVESKIKFNKKEQEIVDAIYTKIDKLESFDKSNLESFEIVSLTLYGYYKSKSNVLYIRVEYNSKCKDNTYDCDHLSDNIGKSHSLEENEPFYFFVKIDINNYDDIEIIGGISAHINSDWVQDYSRIE